MVEPQHAETMLALMDARESFGELQTLEEIAAANCRDLGGEECERLNAIAEELDRRKTIREGRAYPCDYCGADRRQSRKGSAMAASEYENENAKQAAGFHRPQRMTMTAQGIAVEQFPEGMRFEDQDPGVAGYAIGRPVDPQPGALFDQPKPDYMDRIPAGPDRDRLCYLEGAMVVLRDWIEAEDQPRAWSISVRDRLLAAQRERTQIIGRCAMDRRAERMRQERDKHVEAFKRSQHIERAERIEHLRRERMELTMHYGENTADPERVRALERNAADLRALGADPYADYGDAKREPDPLDDPEIYCFDPGRFPDLHASTFCALVRAGSSITDVLDIYKIGARRFCDGVRQGFRDALR